MNLKFFFKYLNPKNGIYRATWLLPTTLGHERARFLKQNMHFPKNFFVVMCFP